MSTKALLNAFQKAPAKKPSNSSEQETSLSIPAKPSTLDTQILSPADVMQLQRTIGNQAVQRLYKNKPTPIPPISKAKPQSLQRVTFRANTGTKTNPVWVDVNTQDATSAGYNDRKAAKWLTENYGAISLKREDVIDALGWLRMLNEQRTASYLRNGIKAMESYIETTFKIQDADNFNLTYG